MAKNKIFIPYFISNEQFAPARVLPRLFFYNGTKQCDVIKVQYYNTGSTLVTIDTFTAFPYFDHYSGETTTTSSLSLLFLNEEPVYGTQPPSQSLYDKYWSNYVNLLYDPKTRLLRCSAVLPFDVYQNIELNDIVQLRSNYYHLRAINDYNLRTGECRIELLGPLLEGSVDNIEFFDNRCEQAPQISNVTNDTGSRIITFNITGSNCCNNPNDLAVQFLWGTGSCPASSSNTTYVTIPNQPTASVNYGFLPYGTTGINCVTMSVANYCYGFATGSFSFVFSGSLSGSYASAQISGSAFKNDCSGSYSSGSTYVTVVPQGAFTSSVSQADANASASAYLTSVSQSNANTFGYCQLFTRTLYVRPLYDIQNTSSLFPITVSAYTTLNTSSAPAENNPSWSVVGVYSGTLASTIQSFQVSTIISSSGQFGWDLIKFRGPSGEKIKMMDTQEDFWGVNGLQEEYYVAPWPNDTTASNDVFPESKFKLYNNNTTQSLGGEGDINLFGRQEQASLGNRLTSSIGGNLSVWSLYTSSVNYPLPGDSKWIQVGTIYPVGTTSMQVFLAGGGTLSNSTRRVFVSASNYYYFKVQDVSGSIVNLAKSYITSGSYVTASSAMSASTMWQASLTQTTASNEAVITLVFKS